VASAALLATYAAFSLRVLFARTGLFIQYLAQRAADRAPMSGRRRSNAHQHSRDALRDRFLAPIVGAMRRIVAHVAPAPGRHYHPTISPYASCCSPVRPFPSG
jgi:hypothetical protein